MSFIIVQCDLVYSCLVYSSREGRLLPTFEILMNHPNSKNTDEISSIIVKY